MDYILPLLVILAILMTKVHRQNKQIQLLNDIIHTQTTIIARKDGINMAKTELIQQLTGIRNAQKHGKTP